MRLRVTPQRWEASRLTALEGFSGAGGGQATGNASGDGLHRKSKIQQMIAEEVRRLEEPERPPRGCVDAPCPTKNRLESLLADSLDPNERPAIEAHVEACPACQQILDS